MRENAQNKPGSKEVAIVYLFTMYNLSEIATRLSLISPSRKASPNNYGPKF